MKEDSPLSGARPRDTWTEDGDMLLWTPDITRHRTLPVGVLTLLRLLRLLLTLDRPLELTEG